MVMVGLNRILNQPSTKRARGGAAVRIATCGVALTVALAGCGGGKKNDGAATGAAGPTSAGANGGATGGTSTTPQPGDTAATPYLPGGVTPQYPAGVALPAFAGNPKDIKKYVDPMKAADAKGMKVWAESDLAAAWVQGKDTFDAAVQKLAAEAKAFPNLVGFKIADELGDNPATSTRSPADALEFLKQARAALHANAPGKLVMIDVIGYDLGCVPGSTAKWRANCLSKYTAGDASMPLETIDQIVNSGYIDAIDVTTNMLNDTQYQKYFSVSQADAQKAAFAEIKKRQWDTKVVVNTRKALSWPTAGNIESADQAASMVPNFVDVPIAAGAKGVDVWAWSQKWGRSGATVYLMNPGYQTNALWNALLAEKAKNATLYVHYTPSYSLGTLDQDMENMSKVFSGVFCAAGTG